MKRNWRRSGSIASGIVALASFAVWPVGAQTAANTTPAQQVQQLTDAIARTQQQLEQSQKELESLQHQLDSLKREIENQRATAAGQDAAAKLASEVAKLRAEQQMQESQIATHDQIKVESGSKYPVRVDGLVLLNGFVNTRQADMAATPTVALWGAGSTGATMRQTMVGLEAEGPNLFGAHSNADVSVDFFGSAPPSDNSTGAYGNNIGLLRLHTAHAALAWQHTEASFAYDRPIVSPNAPGSLTAVAIPALAWSGNLWNWNPQLILRYDFSPTTARNVRLESALINVADPPVLTFMYSSATTATMSPASTAEQSRWPGVETRVAFMNDKTAKGAQFGIGGYFAPHRTSFGARFNAWAGTLDFHQPLPWNLDLTGSFYRGLALGGLGGGAYKDFVARPSSDDPGYFYYRALDDVGGWAQLKHRLNERLQFNAAFGIDNVPANELRPYAGIASAYYQNLARNRTITGNVIYSPSAYLLFSLEYRHIDSSFVNASTAAGDVIGLAAGYKF